MNARVARVEQELAQYEHPLFEFAARAEGDAVKVAIRFKNPPVPVHTYEFQLQPREIDSPQFTWSFQKQLYDCLHDYVIEMFTRNPQMKTY